MALDPQCQTIADEITGLEADRTDAQTELQNAAPPMKAYWASVVKALNNQIRRRRLDLDACNAEHPPSDPLPTCQPLTAYFNGSATFQTTYPQARGPFPGPVSGVLYFPCPRNLVRIIDMGSVTTPPYSTPFGSSTTTVSLDRDGGDTSGIYDPASGALSLRLPLFIDHSLDIPFFVEDSTLVLFMTTNGVPGSDFGDLPGSSMAADGHVVMSGSGRFRDGILNGQSGALTLDGTITPHP